MQIKCCTYWSCDGKYIYLHTKRCTMYLVLVLFKRISMFTKLMHHAHTRRCTKHECSCCIYIFVLWHVFPRIEVDVLLDAVVSNFSNRNDFKLGFYAFAKSWCPSNSLTANANKQANTWIRVIRIYMCVCVFVCMSVECMQKWPLEWEVISK